MNPKEIADIEISLQTLLTEYVREHPIQFSRFKDDLRLAVSPGRVSVAARCVMQGMEGYFEKIRSLYGITLPAQPTHVSLYTLTGKAVGIDTTEEMESFKKVTILEVQNVLNSVHS
jgi:hypothetical protein